MKIVKLLLLVFLSCTLGQKGFSQNNSIDTSSIILSAQLKALMKLEKEVKDKSYYTDFLNYKPQIQYLKSEGFRNFLVFSIIIKRHDDTSNIIYKDSEVLVPRTFFSQQIIPDTLVFACNLINKELYMLRSQGVINAHDVKQVFKFISLTRGRKVTSFTKFNEEFFIEGIDRKKLYEASK